MTQPESRRLVTEQSGDARYDAQLRLTEAQARTPSAASAFALQARTVDTWVQKIKDAPGGKFLNADGFIKVPESVAGSPSDPSLFVKWVLAVTKARYNYFKPTLRRLAATSTTSGFSPANPAWSTSLFLSDELEWHIGPAMDDPNYWQGQGFAFKEHNLPFGRGLVALTGNRNAPIVGYGTADGKQHPIFGTAYRTYRETAVFVDGSVREFNANEGLDYKSTGRGAGAYAEWRWANAVQANLTADVAQGDHTVAVDSVDGIDWAWFAAHGLTPPGGALARRLKVGQQVYVTQGLNPGDAHENLAVMICDVLAINGVTTPGYAPAAPTNGINLAGTITLSEGFKRSAKIAEQFWAFPDTANGEAGSTLRFKAQSDGGNRNWQSLAIYNVDPDLMVYSPYLGNISYRPSARNDDGSGPSALAIFNATAPHARVENLWIAGTAQAALSFNALDGASVSNIHWEGSNQLPTDGIGHMLDVVTCQINADNIFAKGFCSEIAQVESAGEIYGRNWEIHNTHPTNPGLALFNVLGPSRFTLDGLRWFGKGGGMVHRGVGEAQLAPVSVGGKVIIDLDTCPTIDWSDFSIHADVTFSAPDINGARREFRARGVKRERIQVPVLASNNSDSSNATTVLPLPSGVLRTGSITTPTHNESQVSVSFNPNDGTVALALQGAKRADVTGTSVGVWDGTAYHTNDPYMLTSAGGWPTSIKAGDQLTIYKGNLDNSAMVTTVKDVTQRASTPSRIRIADPLVKNVTAGMVINTSGAAIPGETHTLPSQARQWNQKAGYQFGMRHIMGQLADTPAPSTLDLVQSTTAPPVGNRDGYYTLDLELFNLVSQDGPAGRVPGVADGYAGGKIPFLHVGELRVDSILSLLTAAQFGANRAHGGRAGLTTLPVAITGDVQGNAAAKSAITLLVALGVATDSTTDSGAPSAAMPGRQQTSKTAGAAITAGGNDQGTISLATSAAVLSVKSDTANVRFRLYTTSTARTADASRASGIASGSGLSTNAAFDSGVILDVTLADTALHFFNNPITGANNAGTPSIQWPYRIDNIGGATATPAITVVWEKREG